jgi:hypothetical protein
LDTDEFEAFQKAFIGLCHKCCLGPDAFLVTKKEDKVVKQDKAKQTYPKKTDEPKTAYGFDDFYFDQSKEDKIKAFIGEVEKDLKEKSKDLKDADGKKKTLKVQLELSQL